MTGSEVKVLDRKEDSMKFSRRVQLALLLLASIALLGCPNNSGNPSTKHMSGAVAIGQCSNYSWKANCQPSNQANFCPSSGNGDCQLSISDNNTTVTATEPGQQDPNYICVTKNTKVDWMEGGSKLFVVAFGSPGPFANKTAFSGSSAAPDSGIIVSDPSTVPECNKYLVFQCGDKGCIFTDPVVIVQGGHG